MALTIATSSNGTDFPSGVPGNLQYKIVEVTFDSSYVTGGESFTADNLGWDKIEFVVIGNVEDKTAVIFDDMVDTAGTLCNAAAALKEKGAKDVYVYITHAVLSGHAVQKIEKSTIKKLITTDTIDNSQKTKRSKKIEIISLAPMISEAMKRIANSTSVSSLFK